MPSDVWDHFVRMLAPGHEIVTGRTSQRTWRVAGVHPDPDSRTVAGELGWQPQGEEIVPEWPENEMDWIISTASPHGGRIVRSVSMRTPAS
jgi:hypothetical protein